MGKINDATEGLIDAHTHVGVDLLFYLRGYFPYAQDWLTLVRHGDAAGIERFIVFPMVTNLSLSIEAMREGTISTAGALESVPYAFENRRLMVELEHRFPELSPRAIPFWMLDPSRNRAGQVAALRELKQEFRCCGLKIQATILRSFISDLLGAGSVLLEFAAEHDLPLLIHTSTHPDDPWSQNADILKVAEAWPSVRFCLAHSCRFDLPSLDRVAELPNTWFDCSAHGVHCQLAASNYPSVAPEHRRVPSDYGDPARVLADLAARYPGKLMWGSDSPFDSYVDDNLSLVSTYAKEAAMLHKLDHQTKIRIARDNTLQFLSLHS